MNHIWSRNCISLKTFLLTYISWTIYNGKHGYDYCWCFADQPKIALNPLHALKEEGENFTLFCNAKGNPEPNISWIFNGSRIDTNHNSRKVFSNDRQTLTIKSVSRTDSGEYQCMATNNLGNTSSQVATLDVLCKYDVS